MQLINEKKDAFYVAILAAGLSQRMGTSKLFLKTRQGKPFIEHICTAYIKNGFKKIILVVNMQDAEKVQYLAKANSEISVVINAQPELGRFYSLRLAITSINKPIHLLMHNVDNPFAEAELLNDMTALAQDNAYIVPSFNQKNGHPIIIGKEIVQQILTFGSTENPPINKFLKKFIQIKCVVQNKDILANINTPELYQNYLNNL